MRALREREPNIEFAGVGGTQMNSEGFEALADIDRLSVNLLVDPIRKLPDLLSLLRDLESALHSADAVVGIDFNVFNLIMERRMKRRGVPTAHYVSPSVYAWRRGRVKKIARSTDLVMTLFPFEPAYYQAAGIRTEFVGHPLADKIELNEDVEVRRADAKNELGIDRDATVIAILPGSRRSEIHYHADVFFSAATRIKTILRKRKVVFVVPCLNFHTREVLEPSLELYRFLDIRVVEDDSLRVFAAANGAIVKSGTGTLEAMLMRVPMVVAYIAGSLTYACIRAAMHTEYIALPNILTQREFVPELVQAVATPERLARSLCAAMQAAGESPAFGEQCDRLHEELRRDASARAAEAVLALVREKANEIR